jgi:hypothetical protein
VLDFVQHLPATREPANTYRLWRASAILMEGGCSAGAGGICPRVRILSVAPIVPGHRGR